MIYATQLGTTSTVTSIQGLISATYFGLGRKWAREILKKTNLMLIYLGGGIGSAVCGFLVEEYGKRLTFRILGVVAFVTGIAYFIFNVFYLRKIKNEKVNKVVFSVNENRRS